MKRFSCEITLSMWEHVFHGGIYALRHKKRAIIISIDERARSISADTGLITIEKDTLDELPSLINSEFETRLNIPFRNRPLERRNLRGSIWKASGLKKLKPIEIALHII